MDLTGVFAGFVIAILVLIYFATTGDSITINGFKDGLPIYSTQTYSAIQQKADLAGVYLPYIAALNPTTTCNVHGGVWIQNADRVGCFNMGIPVTNVTEMCTSTVALAATEQCQSVGATPICDETNLGCFY